MSPAAITDGTIETCVELGVTVMAYAPLGDPAAIGAVSDPDTGAPQGDLFGAKPVVARLAEIARAGKVGLDAAALAWILAHPAGIRPVIGSTRAARIARSVREASALTFSRDDWYHVLAAGQGKDEMD
jgi:predicted oxidoreductase